MNNPHLSRDEIMVELCEICQQHRSGTLFITADGGHLVRVAMQQGNIHSIEFDAGHSSIEAMQELENITGGRVQFAENIFENAHETPLPDTQKVLQRLCDSIKSLKQGKTPAKPAATGSMALCIKAVEAELANFIGPFAKFTCNDYLEDSGEPKTLNEVEKMILSVATEIDGEVERQHFIVAARQTIAK
ncbi:DUF4388 domain-containing protein [Candidatus Venteria ishoeyi]|uniref:DUF8082 domain-containing protein n=1 Tax=Candidatus Venteria ishoeyi TaxID=1899563 RepID=A0A1H6FCA4_9GAMM|nr:DUF4388 domain-containing protein [Candidatus Venteria ishoeyi]MDM8547065.1 DUF4388 domain-containing protein [Candidatus Venteria ishoeyi]SEH07722.1 Uncharacterised protein [Candidatus Venteria ishoeyi]